MGRLISRSRRVHPTAFNVAGQVWATTCSSRSTMRPGANAFATQRQAQADGLRVPALQVRPQRGLPASTTEIIERDSRSSLFGTIDSPTEAKDALRRAALLASARLITATTSDCCLNRRRSRHPRTSACRPGKN
jgi:hypothetical protein